MGHIIWVVLPYPKSARATLAAIARTMTAIPESTQVMPVMAADTTISRGVETLAASTTGQGKFGWACRFRTVWL